MRRDRCGGCGSEDLEVFLDLGKTPLADAFPKDAADPETYYPLELAVCPQCWLVQLLEVVPDDLLFGADYGFYSSTSPSLAAYHEAYAADVLRGEFAEQARRLTVEVACNDGSLLRHFAAAGCRAVGVDPATGAAEAARGRGLTVLAEPFNRKAASRIRNRFGPAGLVIANNVLAHVADLDDFVAGMADLLAVGGAIIVEVQYLPDLIAGNQFDHVYHEHRYFFSLTSLLPILARHGLRIHHVEHTPAQGGSIRVTAVRGAPAESPVGGESFVTSMATYQTMQGRVHYMAATLRDLLAAQRHEGRKVAGYAASAKSTTLLNFCRIGPELVDHIVDTTPHKIGRVTPGTHIPIVAPGDRTPPDIYLLLAWNYLSGVLRREREFLDDGGRFIVPIPAPVLL